VAAVSTQRHASALMTWPPVDGGDGGQFVAAARRLSSVAREIGVRPDTLLEMARGDRSPSAATVLALTEWCDETMDLDRVRQP
jgi:hypothetical protein